MMKAYSLTDIGRRRKVNQDYAFVSENPVGHLPNLFIIADGMGGHNAGDFASSFAVQTIVATIDEDADYNPIKIMRHAIETANARLLTEAAKAPQMAGMGTTVVAATITGKYIYVANVGDSRLYIMQNDEFRQVTRDHSLVQEMVRLGELTPEEARNHPDKNIITRALGARENVNVDFFDLTAEGDVQILLCSDGLSNMLTDEEIQEILKEPAEVPDKVRTLVIRANENGGKDNIAVILIESFTDEV